VSLLRTNIMKTFGVTIFVCVSNCNDINTEHYFLISNHKLLMFLFAQYWYQYWYHYCYHYCNHYC